MFNSVESSDDEFEWGKVEGVSASGGDSKKSDFKFLNGQTESEVKGTLQSQSDQKSFHIYLEHTDYNVNQEISAGDRNDNKTKVTQEEYYNRHFIFDNVTSFGITGLRWNVPICDYFDILIPSLPDEAFVKNMFNEPIISRQTGGSYYQDSALDPSIPSTFKGKGEYKSYIEFIDPNTTYNLEFTVTTVLSKNTIPIIYELSKEQEGTNTLTNFIKGLTHDQLLSVSTCDENDKIIKFLTDGPSTSAQRDVGQDQYIIQLSKHNILNNINTNDLNIIKKIFGYDDTDDKNLIDIINIERFQPGADGHSQINFQENFDVSAQFSSPISLDFNSIKIYAKFYGIPKNTSSHPNTLDLSSINKKLIEVYPTNELTIQNLSKKFNIDISNAHDGYYVPKHIFFEVSVTTK